MIDNKYLAKMDNVIIYASQKDYPKLRAEHAMPLWFEQADPSIFELLRGSIPLRRIEPDPWSLADWLIPGGDLPPLEDADMRKLLVLFLEVLVVLGLLPALGRQLWPREWKDLEECLLWLDPFRDLEEGLLNVPEKPRFELASRLMIIDMPGGWN